MRYKATHDALTSLFNRGVIRDLLTRKVSRVRREKVSTAILLCDLDHFKRISDTHGHLVGDEVLQEVARRLLYSVRSYDYVGRYGGEEVLLILNNCTAAAASGSAEEIRLAISYVPVETSVGALPITMSIGLHHTENWGLRSVEELLQEVDSALYTAKAAGRNRVSIAKTDVSSPSERLMPTHAGKILS